VEFPRPPKGIADTVAALDEHDPYRDAENPYTKGGPKARDPIKLNLNVEPGAPVNVVLGLYNEPLTTGAMLARNKQAPISSCSYSFKDMTGCVWPIVVERYQGGGVTIRITSEPPAQRPISPAKRV